MEVITTKKELLEALVKYSDDDRIVIEVHDEPLNEDLYRFTIDEIHMGLDENYEDRGFEIRLCPVRYDEPLRFIDEDDEVKFDKYEELSYKDYSSENIVLYIKNMIAGEIKVWQDSEMEDREYICLNHEIVYLDELTKI